MFRQPRRVATKPRTLWLPRYRSHPPQRLWRLPEPNTFGRTCIVLCWKVSGSCIPWLKLHEERFPVKHGHDWSNVDISLINIYIYKHIQYTHQRLIRLPKVTRRARKKRGRSPRRRHRWAEFCFKSDPERPRRTMKNWNLLSLTIKNGGEWRFGAMKTAGFTKNRAEKHALTILKWGYEANIILS